MDEFAILRSLLPSLGPGLEIGPLHRSVAPKRGGYDVDILDHGTTDEIKAKYRADPNVDISLIEDVDFVSDGGSMLETIGSTKKYDWIVASHVIEHSTALLGFLLDCQELLREGGTLVLAIPHKRFCFDALRPVTTIGQVLQAHHERRKLHSFAALYDCFSEFCFRGDAAAWGEGHPGKLRRRSSSDNALEYMKQIAQTSGYFDTHEWVFVPASFRLIVETLFEHGLIALREKDLRPTVGCEFFITLSRDGKGPCISTNALRRVSEEEQFAALLERFGSLPSRLTDEPCDAEEGEHAGGLVSNSLRARLFEGQKTSARFGELECQIAQLKDELKQTHDELTQARDRLAFINRTMSWRATAPFRDLRGKLSSWSR